VRASAAPASLLCDDPPVALRICCVHTERHVVLAKERQLATFRVIVEVCYRGRIRAAGRHVWRKRPACALTVADRIAGHCDQPKGWGRGNPHTTGAPRPHPQLVLGSVRVEIQNDAAVVTRCQDVLKINLVSILVVTSAYQFDILPNVTRRRTWWLGTVNSLIGSYVHGTNCLRCAALAVKVETQVSARNVRGQIRVRRHTVRRLVDPVEVVASFKQQRSRRIVVIYGHRDITARRTSRCPWLASPGRRPKSQQTH